MADLWLPESYIAKGRSGPPPTDPRSVALEYDLPHSEIRAAAAAAWAARSMLLTGNSTGVPGSPTYAAAPGIGSPYVRRADLIALWRRHSWIRAGVRRIAMIAIAEGWEIMVAPDTDPKTAPDDEYEFLARFFAPELLDPTNIRQWQLPRQKMLVTFERLKLLGEAYWEIVPNGFGDPVDFAVVFGQVVPVVDRLGNFIDPERAYVQMHGNGREFFGVNELLRFEIPDIDGRLGVSDFEALEVAATTDLYAQIWNRNTFKNNRTPPGAYMFDPSVSEETMRENREALDALYSGVENANKAYLALKGIVDYKPFGTAFARDQEYLRGRRFNRDEIFSLIGTPAGVLGIVEDVNRANLEGLIEIVHREEARPLQEIVEETINLWIKSLGIDRWVFRFRQPVFGSEADEVRNARERILAGLSTPNQERAKKGLPGYPGGNRYYVANSVSEIGVDEDDDVGMQESALEEEPEEPEEPEQEPAEFEDEDEDEAKRQAILTELRQWKRVAVRTAKGELRPRRFKASAIPPSLYQRIRASVAQVRRNPEAVRVFFDGLIAELDGPRKKKLVRVETEVPASKAIEEGLDSWPEWARERLNARMRADLDYSLASLDERLARLEAADDPSLD